MDNIDLIEKMVIQGIYSVCLEKERSIGDFTSLKRKIHGLFDNYKKNETIRHREKAIANIETSKDDAAVLARERDHLKARNAILSFQNAGTDMSLKAMHDEIENLKAENERLLKERERDKDRFNKIYNFLSKEERLKMHRFLINGDIDRCCSGGETDA